MPGPSRPLPRVGAPVRVAHFGGDFERGTVVAVRDSGRRLEVLCEGGATLAFVLSPAAARREYAETFTGARARAAATQEDSWQRATELLFERLAVRWTIADAPIERQRELLARFRVASAAERAWVREAIREHCAAHFADVDAP